MRTDPRPAWKAIVAAGALMPVSDIERARHQRVNATHRAVYGLPATATDDELIDARQGDTRSVAELAALYLRDYAARINPEDPHIEDVDRAALPWASEDVDPDLIDALRRLVGDTTPEPQPSLFPDAWDVFVRLATEGPQ